MALRIHKFPLVTGFNTIEIQPDARLLKVDRDPANPAYPAIWAEVDTDFPATEKHDFKIYGTGHDIEEPEAERNYVGTAICDPFVWHVFEVPTEEAKVAYANAQAAAVDAAAAQAIEAMTPANGEPV